jgi:S-(hydroxymethyl)glutathione dehydrogenase/alcohol dehydrogenase
MTFRAAVLNQVGAPLTIETLAMAPLQANDVLVRVRASGLCHTDLEVIQGTLAYPMPIVLGHEGAGVVEAVGSAVSRVKEGDHVICSWNPHCGHCFYCERGVPILCEPYKQNEPRGLLLDGSSRLSRDGGPVHHFFTTSTHAELTVVPESGAIAVSKEIAFDRACIIGCGVMTGVGAAVRKARVEPGASVVVIGCGAVGLNVLQGARLAGAATIIAVDVGAARLARARQFGASMRSTRAAKACSTRCERSPAAAAPTTSSRPPVTRQRSGSRSRRCGRPARSSGSARSTSTPKSRSAGAH